MNRIEWRRLRNLTAREIGNALTRDGFSLLNQRGSHQRYHHADGRRVTLTFHRASDTFPIGTLRSMIELQARWTEEDLRRLSLLNSVSAIRSGLISAGKSGRDLVRDDVDVNDRLYL